MADVATIALELDSSGLQRGVREAEEALRKLKGAGDQVGQSQQQAGRGTASAGKEMAAAAREANAYLQATARLQRAYGDYSGAVATLNTQLKGLTATSSQYVRVQAQIAQIQAQAGRVARGESFAGFAASLKGIQGQLGELQKFGAAIANLPGLGGAGIIAGRIGGIATAIESAAASAAPATVALGAMSAGVLALGAAAVYGSKQIIDLALAGGRAADQLSDLAQILGVSPAFLEKLGTAYKLAGKDVGSAQQALTAFETRLGDAATGNAPKLEKALRSIGINAKTAGSDIEGAFTKVVQTLAASSDQTKVAAVATELFGRKGLEVVSVYKEMADSNSTLNQELRRFGLLAGGTVLASAASLGDAQDKLALRFDVIQKILAAKMAPALNDVTVKFLEFSVKAQPAIEAVAASLGSVLGVLGSIAKFLGDHPFLASVLAGPTLGPAGAAAFLTQGGGRTDRSTVAVSHGGFKVGGLSDDLRGALSGPKPPPNALEEFLAALKNGPKAGGGREPKEVKPFEFKDTQGLTVMVQALRDAVIASSQLGKQSLPQLEKSITDITGSIDTLTKELAVLPPTSREAATVAAQLNKAETELTVARRKQFELLQATRLPARFPGQLNTDDFLKALPKQPLPSGVVAAQNAEAERRAEEVFRRSRSTKFEDFFGPNETRKPGELLGLKEQFFGRDDTQTGERVRGAGELIVQDFLTGALLGQADAKRAGEQIAFFFADYTAKKMTDALSKQLDKAFDFLAGVISKFLQRILTGASGGGGLLGSIAGTLAGAFFGGGAAGFKLSNGGSINFIPGTAGGGYAGGGFVSAGRPSLVGELGPEMFIPRTSGWIINQQQAAAAAAGGGGGMNVTMNFNISAPNGQVDRRSIDQMSENALFALSRAQRNRGA